MDKPKSRWAIAMWTAAAGYGIGILAHILSADGASLSQQGPLAILMWVILQPGALSCGMLAGMGALIEPVDQIRWDAAKTEIQIRAYQIMAEAQAGSGARP